ncbi:helix-turn-helix transcriptional regulator [Massilia sp. W12]|uniref:helix-turn-helix domain-containing protein n=1 Tax=Massilia sp. W12 TaxID=3126507 RepID=UPI0030D4F645
MSKRDLAGDSISAFCQRMVAMREFFGLSQAAMADRVGCSRSIWQRYERGTEPGALQIARVAKLGVDVHWLLTGEGSMLRKPERSLPDVPQQVLLAAQLLDDLQADYSWLRVPAVRNALQVFCMQAWVLGLAQDEQRELLTGLCQQLAQVDAHADGVLHALLHASPAQRAAWVAQLSTPKMRQEVA